MKTAEIVTPKLTLDAMSPVQANKVFKNVRNKKLRDSVILLKLSMNANIVKMQISHKIKYDLRGHSRSQIMTFLIKIYLFFCLYY